MATKSYVEKIYIETHLDKIGMKGEINPVKSKKPELYVTDEKVQKVRFFDEEIPTEMNKKRKIVNYSGWIIFGERIDIKKFKSTYGTMDVYKEFLKEVTDGNYKYICYTRGNYFIPMEDNDITYDEYLESSKQILNEEKVEPKKTRKPKRESKSNTDIEKLKYTLMKEGIRLVRKGEEANWLQFVDQNIANEHYEKIIELTVAMMLGLEENMSFEEIRNGIYNSGIDVDDFVLGEAAMTTIYFATKGKELKDSIGKKGYTR